MASSSRRLFFGLYMCLLGTQSLAQNDFPDTGSFLRAATWAATVIDEYIYIDGGEVSQEGNMDFRQSNQINVTLSIDCTASWSPEDVTIRELQRPESMPVLSQQAILTDHASKSFYVWGGYLPFQRTADFSKLWRFTTDGEGGGRWDSEAPEDQDVFANLERTENAAYASTGGDVDSDSDGGLGFIFGGKMLNDNGKVDQSQASLTGFRSFDFKTKDWSEVQDGDGYSQDGSIWGGTATFVRGFGARGVVVVLGGLSRPDQPGEGYMDWATVNIYDIAEEKWHRQEASGEAPSRRAHHCAVGVADTSGNGSYEIFVYGGANRDQRTDYGTVYALSLPGFTWTKVNDEEGRNRTDHACVNVGGNSQLISLGGINFQNLRRFEWESRDPYPRGLAIFDMNRLAWVDSYDADADRYATHEDIKSWYESGGLDEMEWSDDQVRALFNQSSPAGGNPGTNSQDEEEEVGDNEGSSSTPVGAIAGGVVAGVVGLAIISLAVWYFLWRPRHAALSASQAAGADADENKPLPPIYASELDPTSTPVELPVATMTGSSSLGIGSFSTR